MTKVFDDPMHAGDFFSQERLNVLKMIFVEFYDEHKLTHSHQFKRDTLALTLLEADKTSTDESVLRMAGLKQIIWG